MEHSGELTRQERIVADLIILEHKFPGGLQLEVQYDLDKAIEAAGRLFAEYDLPLRAQLIDGLTAWRSHADEGIRLKEPCYDTLHAIIDKVSRKR